MCLYVFKCRVYIENAFDFLSGLLPLTPRSPIPSICLQKCSLVFFLLLASNPLCIITRSSVHWLMGIALALYLGHYGWCCSEHDCRWMRFCFLPRVWIRLAALPLIKAWIVCFIGWSNLQHYFWLLLSSFETAHHSHFSLLFQNVVNAGNRRLPSVYCVWRASPSSGGGVYSLPLLGSGLDRHLILLTRLVLPHFRVKP